MLPGSVQIQQKCLVASVLRYHARGIVSGRAFRILEGPQLKPQAVYRRKPIYRKGSNEHVNGRLETIRIKLERLIQRDEAQSVFGAGGGFGHHYVRRAVLDEPAVRCLEDSFGVRLPKELRAFLMTVHGGGAGPGYGFFVHADNPRVARRAGDFPFDSNTAREVIAKRLAGGSTRWQTVEAPDTDDEDEDDWPPGTGFIPIAHQGCGVFDVIVVAGEQRGRVWWYDMSWSPWYDKTGQQMGFLDWYELWLDSSLRSF